MCVTTAFELRYFLGIPSRSNIEQHPTCRSVIDTRSNIVCSMQRSLSSYCHVRAPIVAVHTLRTPELAVEITAVAVYLMVKGMNLALD
jgi:hypothetical protein